jgi:Bacterial protein of unknown function (DUF885)
MKALVLALSAALLAPHAWAGEAPTLEHLASDFWAWRARYQPFNSDDIPRIEREPGLTRSWSEHAIASERVDLAAFEERWKRLEDPGAPVARQVDYRLMGSALARVRWELDINRRFEHDPTFYVDQTLTPVLETLLPPPPFDEARARELVHRLRNVVPILEEAKRNLRQAAPPFAGLAIQALADVRARLDVVARDVAPLLPSASRAELVPAATAAASALESFRGWLEERLPNMTGASAVGREAYEFFFAKVALYPFTPQQLLALSRQEWARSVAFETLERHRNQQVPPLAVASTSTEQASRTRDAEEAVRRFLRDQGLLTLPADLPHYETRPIPPYLTALAPFGELDDFTGPSRLDQDAVRWFPPPSGDLGYFEDATARDPRPLIVHEGVPGHYMQLWLGWRSLDPIRRHYYDSGANEGLGFYAEEMLLEAGLFDDSPRTREIIGNFMRLRALRVEADVNLALGRFTLDQAADYLARTVPMNPVTARNEAAFFATQPGQAVSYQAGKLQIVQLLAEARRREGDRFDLRAFHDFVWRNGNVPIELQRLEWFGKAAKSPGGKGR